MRNRFIRRRFAALVPLILLAGCAGAPMVEGLQVPGFVERAAEAGLTHRFAGDGDLVVGGGAAAFDCDGDGDPDLALAGGRAAMAVFVNLTEPGAAPRFAAAAEALPGLDARLRGVTGVYAVDLDNDRAIDLVATRFGDNLILRNRGDCRFEEVSARWGLGDTGFWTTAFAAAWIGDDVYPTLLFGNYVRRDRKLEKRGNCEPSLVVRPLAGGGTDGGPRYGAPVPLARSHCALSIRQVEWRGAISNVGESVDFWIANDRQYADPDGREQLLSVGPQGVRLYTRDEGWVPHRIWGMGVAAADIEGDGALEVAVTNMAENQFFVLAAPGGDRPGFRNEAWRRGAAAQRPHIGGDPRPSTSWHAAFEDLNNDGRLDLLIVKGNVEAMAEFAAFDPDSLLLGRGDGSFVEAGGEAGIGLKRAGRGAAVFDADGDGCLDLAVVNRNAPLSFFHGECAGLPPAIALELVRDGANAFAVGARLRVAAAGRPLARWRAVGGGHGGSSLLPVHLGAPEGPVAVRVRWPDGAESGEARLTAGYRYRWRQGEAVPHRLTPHTR